MGPNTTLNIDALLGPGHEAREGSTMERYVVDGREAASGMECTVTIAADDPDELEEAAAEPMTQVHQHEDDRELRYNIRNTMHETEGQAM
jgi:predicted small metal-binding protein